MAPFIAWDAGNPEQENLADRASPVSANDARIHSLPWYVKLPKSAVPDEPAAWEAAYTPT